MLNLDKETTRDDLELWNFYFDQDSSNFKGAKSRLDLVAEEIGGQLKSGRVLDVGLGNGYLLSLLAGEGYETYGLDLSDVNIKKLKKILTKTELKIGNVTRLPFADGFFDAVVASELLEHLDDEDLKLALINLRRSLKPGGYIFVTVPSDEELEEYYFYCPRCNQQFHKYGHKQSFSRIRLQKELEEAGFSTCQVKKILEISPDASFYQKLKYKIKLRLANLPYHYFSSFRGRYLAKACR